MSRHLCLIFANSYERFREYRDSLVLMYACYEIAYFNVFMRCVLPAPRDVSVLTPFSILKSSS